MTEYMYLKSDKPMVTGAIGDRGLHVAKISWYRTEASMESFYFETTTVGKSATYEVDSYAYKLPEANSKKVNGKEKKAVSILYDYIVAHFAENAARFLNITFVLNGYENGSMKKIRRIQIGQLRKEDLYYSEATVLEIVR
ncbi:hypothetical protein ACFOU0_06580 [Salinicoccus sesuvii]|uniref:Uncharacterized protein n=1 Tax=Salinicoccus sesuvii TaxID=868281 RepID=A0ABV7N3P8_9STAP